MLAGELDEQTRMCSRKQGVLLEPEAGYWLWPLVLQNLGSAHADANRRLWSTRRSHLPLMLGPGWHILSAQGAVLVKPVFFCTETGSACFHRQGFVCAPDCLSYPCLLLQGKKGLRKRQVWPCFGVPKHLHSARMLGSLQKLELLHFCSMIFGYEVLNEGRGREEICPTSRDLFFSCSEPAPCWVSKVFTKLFVKIKPAFSRGARGHLGLRSCSPGGLMPSSRPWLTCSTVVPGVSSPCQPHFVPPSPS